MGMENTCTDCNQIVSHCRCGWFGRKVANVGDTQNVTAVLRAKAAQHEYVAVCSNEGFGHSDRKEASERSW
jgi:hypothetical protein